MENKRPMPDIPLSVVEYFRARTGGDGFRNPPIRSSAIGTLDTCRRKFLLDERLGIKGRGYQGALGRGDIYHQFRAHLLLGTPWADAVHAVRTKFEWAKAELAEKAAEAGYLGGRDIKSVLSEMDEDFQVAQAMAEASWSLYPLDFNVWEIVKHPVTNEPLVETLYECEWRGYPVVMQFDVILRDKRNGNIWISDDKTTRLSPRAFGSSKSFSWQIRLYRYGLEKLLGVDPVGAVHTIIKVPTIRQTQKETFPQYIERLKGWYKTKAEENPDDPPIAQSWTRFGGPIEDEEFITRIGSQAAWSQRSPSPNLYPRNDGACFKFDRPCPYLELCCSDPVQWPGIIDSRFDIRFRGDENNG